MNRSKLLFNYVSKFGTCEDSEFEILLDRLYAEDEDEKYVYNDPTSLHNSL